MGWLINGLGYVWSGISSLWNITTSSVVACVVGIVAVIKTDTNMCIKASVILLTLISALAATYFIGVGYTSSCTHIVTLATIALITWIFTPILIGLSRLSTVALPFATLLTLGYQEQACTFFNSVMRSKVYYTIRTIEN